MKDLILKLRTLLPAKDFIVTGSFVLAEYGLMDKSRINDLDIILINPEQSTVDTINRLMADFPAKTKPLPITNVTTEDTSGRKLKAVKSECLKAIFMFDQIKVDVLIMEAMSEPTLLVNGIKYCTVSHIINAKKSYGRMKDWLQLRDVARLFFKEEEFNHILNSSWRNSLNSDY